MNCFDLQALRLLKMGISFPKFSWWLWSGSKEKAVISNNSSSLNSFSPVPDHCDSGFRELDETLKFPTRKQKWERDGEESSRGNSEDGYEIVIVASECESDGPDWSIGWEEPHGPGFVEDNEIKSDGGFAVLVPCYGPGCKKLCLAEGSKGKLFSDGNKSVQQWFSSIQNF